MKGEMSVPRCRIVCGGGLSIYSCALSFFIVQFILEHLESVKSDNSHHEDYELTVIAYIEENGQFSECTSQKIWGIR